MKSGRKAAKHGSFGISDGCKNEAKPANEEQIGTHTQSLEQMVAQVSRRVADKVNQ